MARNFGNDKGGGRGFGDGGDGCDEGCRSVGGDGCGNGRGKGRGGADDLEFFARCAAGFEDVLARELRGLGLRRVRPLKGGVAFFGPASDAYRACLWSRVATRIQLVLARLDARDADALYAGVVRFAWEDLVAPGATIAVQAHGANDALRNTQFTALKVKDALCDRLRAKRGARPDVDAHDPGFEVDVSLHRMHATLFLNLSGPSLHRRGYREQAVQTEAPLKETLAAGMLLAAGWPELARGGAACADPMCGSGTLAIEAALMAADRAPGLARERWGFEGWLGHDANAWQRLRAEARERADKGMAACTCAIVAGDLDGRAVEIARRNARRAGVEGLVRFSVADAATLEQQLAGACGRLPQTGLVAVNPPYGHRLESAASLPEVYAALARGIAGLPEGWRMVAITPDAGIDTALGLRAGEAVPCFNGPIRTTVRLYGELAARRTRIEVVSLAGEQRQVGVAEPNSAQFAARLRKVAKERARWARRTGVGCYRIYDADLPDYALSVDVFAGAGPDKGKTFVRVAEHPAPPSVDGDRADVRFSDACALVAAVLDADPAHVAAVSRQPERQPAGEPLIARVAEGGLSFEVNFSARQDTGLALDHRATRELVGSLARGVRFASLGSYAGAPAAYAAAGAAVRVDVVDASSSYLAWARRNLEANGFGGARCGYACADVGAWLGRAAAGSYGLVFADAAALAGAAGLRSALGLLAPGGALVLTSGARSFAPDGEAIAACGATCEDITERTIAQDFSRTPRIHRCWLIRRRDDVFLDETRSR